MKLIIRDVKEDNEEVFNQLSVFLQSMIYDTEYLIEMDKDVSEEDKIPESE